MRISDWSSDGCSSDLILFPLNAVGDKEGCTRHPDGSVTTPTGFKAAYDTYVEGGWTTLNAPIEYGGQGLPSIVGTAVSEYTLSAKLSFKMYTGLTNAAVEALIEIGRASGRERVCAYV